MEVCNRGYAIDKMKATGNPQVQGMNRDVELPLTSTLTLSPLTGHNICVSKH